MSLGKISDYSEFISCCEEMVNKNNNVSLDLDKLSNLHVFFTGDSLLPPDWSWNCRHPMDKIASWYDFVLNASLNGGYYYLEGDKVKKWEKNGSGSQALEEWIFVNLWKEERLPGVHLFNPKDVGITLKNKLKGIPYAEWRLNVLKDFAYPDLKEDLTMVLLSAELPDWSYSFTFEQVDMLVKMFPKAFGGDPFRKKAILACLLMGAWLLNRGENVFFTLPIPSDYQIPRVFNWSGVINLSDSFANRIKDDTQLLDQNSPDVLAFRAAACVAASKLGDQLGLGDNIIDNFLFLGPRHNDDYNKNSLNPMRCNTTWY